MKDKKIGSNLDSEMEKTAFEKFEDEVKGTIFNVLYVLLKDDETSHWKHIVEILIDFMQIYHFSFAHLVSSPFYKEGLEDNLNIDAFPMEI
jgi:hypothetical protein